MESSSKPAAGGACRSFIALAAAMLTAVLAASISGCASPGPAKPPSLHLPLLVTDLLAVRTGNEVVLRWTTPDKTTDGIKIQFSVTAELCRQLPAAATCTPVKRITVRPGLTETSEMLPQSLTTQSPTLLIYRIQLLNANNRSAGLSSPVFAAAGIPPQPVEHLRATPIRNGAMLEWQPQPTPSFIELDRTLVQSTAPKPPASKQPLQLSFSTPTEIHLQTGKQSADAGGTIDPTAQRGETYRYTAQRVRSVTLDGHSLEIRSTPSPVITVAMRDTFPPRAPTGLAAVPGNGAIDLSWEPDTEPDLVGYIIYRRSVSSTAADASQSVRLTPNPVPAPAFSDRTAVPGQTYAYRVTAIDTDRNESPASAEAQESSRNQ